MTTHRRDGRARHRRGPSTSAIPLRARRGLRAFLYVAALATVTGAVADDTPCTVADAGAKHLVLETTRGVIAIELFDDAAPGAVARLERLAVGRDGDAGYFDGLTFDYTRPRHEIRTAAHATDAAELPVELDAAPLGLDTVAARSDGEAMDIVQGDLMPAARTIKRTGRMTPRMRDWLETWYESRDPGFLVGVSRRAINEALGYVYTDGLASRPVTAGSVALVPSGPTTATARLSIALRDMPARTGRWMVVGRVVDGLDVVESISVAPLQRPRHVKPRSYAPLDPVVIESANSTPPECRRDVTEH